LNRLQYWKHRWIYVFCGFILQQSLCWLVQNCVVASRLGKVFELPCDFYFEGVRLAITVFVPSIKDRELEEGKMKAVRLKGKPILLLRVSGDVYAVSNVCPHEGCSFQGGILTGYTLMCPCHGWKFDVRNGQYQEIPQVKLDFFRCKSENGRIFVEVHNKAGHTGFLL